MRAVIDTNVLVAAFRSKLLYEVVLKRPEQRLASGLTLAEIDQALSGLSSLVEPVDVWFLWRPQLRDPDDEMVLEAAINGRADRLVTFNARDFEPGRRFGVGVATPQGFLQEIGR
jgi:predicted nucleic acid-binding protein